MAIGRVPAGDEGLLGVERVSKSFRRGDDETLVLDQVSLQVGAGEFVALLGPSGCGKTTLLRILDGLVLPDSGQVYLDGKAVVGPSRRVGFVFQADSLWPWRDALGNVAFGLEIQRSSARDGKARARELLRLVGLDGFEHHFPHELSGGMRQRVNLARALAIDPDLILMDEPFAALDAQTREVMQLEVLRIWSGQRKTVVFVTHQIEEAVFLSDRVVVMTAHPGRLKEVVDIPFDRPRDLAVKRTGEFNTIVDHIWRLIEDQVIGLKRATAG